MQSFVITSLSSAPFIVDDDDGQSYPFVQYIKNNGHRFQPSTVGHQGTNVIDQNARHSGVIHGLTLEISGSNVTCEAIKAIVPSCFKRMDFSMLLQQDFDDCFPREWDLLAYDPFGHFVKHIDGQSSEDHYGTLLLFPPAELSQFEGGDLVLYTSVSQEPQIIKVSQLRDWTLVAFPLQIAHECRPVVSGTRYVFKSPLIIPTGSIKLFDIRVDAHPLTVDLNDIKDDVKILQAQVDQHLRAVEQLKTRINQLSQLLPTGQILDTLVDIDVYDDQNVVVVLDRKYAIPDPTQLRGKDRILYNEIIKRHPKTQIVNFQNVRRNQGDGSSEPSSELIIKDSGTDCIERLIYQTDLNSKQTPGHIVKEETQFNDVTYDSIVHLEITGIVIQKEQESVVDAD